MKVVVQRGKVRHSEEGERWLGTEWEDGVCTEAAVETRWLGVVQGINLEGGGARVF